MALAHNILIAHGLDFKGEVIDGFILDDNLHPLKGIMVSEFDDVGVIQSDTSLAGTTGHALFVIGAALYADATVTGCQQAQEPVAIGLDRATTIFEVVSP